MKGFDVLLAVDHASKPGKQILVGRDEGGKLAVLEEDDAGRMVADQSYDLDELMRIAENVLARNPRALTWPQSLPLIAAGFLAVIALLERGPAQAVRVPRQAAE